MRILLFAVSLATWAAPALAQERDQFERTIERLLESRYETTAALASTEHTRYLYGGYLTLSLLGADDLAAHTRIQRQVDARLWAQIDSGGHTLYGRVRLRYRDWNTGDSFDGNDDDLVDPVGDRYWYGFDWRRDQRAEEGTDPAINFWVQAGRQYIHWASGIVLSDDLFAVTFGVEKGRLAIDGMIGITPSDTVDFDASRPGYNTNTDRTFYGVRATWSGAGHQPYIFFVSQDDGNNDVYPGPGGPVIFAYDSKYIAIGSVGELSGELLYRVEVIRESGTSISDIFGVFPQTLDDIEAWAGRLQIIFVPHAARHSTRLRLEFEVLVGTGDTDRASSNHTVGGNVSGTPDKAFNAFGFAETGLVLAPELANLLSLRVSASLFPLQGHALFERLQVRVDVFYFLKLDDAAQISVPTFPGSSDIGLEVDVTLIWQVLSDVAVDLRYGVFFPGSALPGSNELHFAYLGISYAF